MSPLDRIVAGALACLFGPPAARMAWLVAAHEYVMRTGRPLITARALGLDFEEADITPSLAAFPLRWLPVEINCVTARQGGDERAAMGAMFEPLAIRPDTIKGA